MKTCILTLVLLIGLLHSSLGAYIELPEVDELAESYEALPRLRRQVSLKGEGGSNQGFIQGSGKTTLYQDHKTKLDGTLGAGAQWQKGFPSQYSGSARLDADRTLWTNGRTSVHGTGFAERNVGTGMRPHDSFGAGAEVRHTLATGRYGQLEAFGGYQRQWNTPNNHQFNAGLGLRF